MNGVSSNNLIGVSPVTYANINLFGPNPYTTGYVGLGANFQNWSTSLCNNTEYIQFTAQPTGTAQLTLNSLTFAFSHSPQGPQVLSVRSSVDGYASDIYSSAVTTSYQTASIPLNGSGFVNQTSPITFRIYACNPTSGGATIHLDEIQLNGQSLPVTLVSFTAKPQGDAVQLSWSTTAEQDADHFEIQRSRDLGEFSTVGQVAAKGTTNQRQYYGFTDLRPLDGANYYRLKQVDVGGRTDYSKVISTVLDNQTPSLELLGNPTDGAAIQVAVRNLADATYHLTTLTGREMPLTADNQADGSIRLMPNQSLPSGLYVLRANAAGLSLQQKIIVFNP